MAGQTPYIDLDTLKAYLSIAQTDDSQDVFLATLIPMVQGFIERFTGRSFGWGDPKDRATIDYSNTDNIAILSSTLNGDLLTLNTAGPVPWRATQNVQIFGMPTPAWNGVWGVATVVNASQIIVNIAVSKGTLGLSALATIANMGTGGQGYIGNYVSNYKYISQEAYDGITGNSIYLRNMDIRSIDTMYLGSRNIAQPTLLDHTQYVWRDDGRILLGGAYFNSYDSQIWSEGNDSSFFGAVASGYQTITVSYWMGGIDVPAEIALAALDIATSMYTLRKSLGIQSEKVGDYEVRYDMGFRKALSENPDSLKTLNMFKRRNI